MSARVFVDDGGGRDLAARVLTEIRNPACPDAFLVSAAQQGNPDAFSVLVERYHRKVYGIVYRMCGAGDGDDLTQDIFLRALQALRGFKYQGEASFRTWLYRIAVNACINELRKRRRHREVDGPSLDEVLENDGRLLTRSVPDNTTAPHEVVEQQETKAAVHAVLKTLSPKHQAVLTLVDLQGMEYEDAARAIGCPLGTLKSRVARARAAFATKYRRYLQGPVPRARAGV